MLKEFLRALRLTADKREIKDFPKPSTNFLSGVGLAENVKGLLKLDKGNCC